MKKVSVVVPVYNVERYLERCVESIRNQSYRNLEIILVDDGSPDGCPELCDKLAELDNRIRVIHQSNIGLGATRNRGLLEASGEYISYVDSDDWIDRKYVESYVEEIETWNADFVASNSFYRIFDNQQTICRSLPAGEYTGEDRKEILMLGGLVSMCMKLFRREWLIKNRLLQPEIYTYEDWGTYPNVVCTAAKVYVLDQPHYCYTVAREGCITTGSEKRLLQGFEQTISFMLNFMKQSLLWDRNRSKLKYYCMKDYYMRCRLNRQSGNRDAAEILKRIRDSVLRQEFGYLNLEQKKYIVFGSFSLRWEVQKGCLVWNEKDSHFCFSSIISTFSRPMDCDVIHENIFRQQQVKQEMQSTFLKEIERADESSVVFLDFMEERFHLLEILPDTYITESDAFSETNLQEISYIRKVQNESDSYMVLWKKACDCLIALLKRCLKQEQVVIVKNRMALQYGDFVKTEFFAGKEELFRINQRLEEMEKYFCDRMPGVVQLEVNEDLLFTDPGLIYGCKPEYLNEAAYVKIGYEMFDKVISRI